ncbi:MAG: YdjY domain-containing protein [Bacteroidota bacterium]
MIEFHRYRNTVTVITLKIFTIILSISICRFVGQGVVRAQSAAQPDSSENPIKKIGDDLFQLGTIRIDSKNRVLTMPGKINMQKGMIELVACATGGKTHESVVVVDVVPYHLQVALILLGLNYIGGLSVQGDTLTPRGDSVDVFMTWNKNGQDTTVRAEDFAWDIPNKRSMEHTPWIFSGSRMIDGKYMADVEKSLVTTYHDPNSILDNPLSTGRDDETYRVNESLVPPKGTPVKVTIKSIH